MDMHDVEQPLIQPAVYVIQKQMESDTVKPPVENAAPNTAAASHQPEVSPGKSANQEIQTIVKVTPKTKDVPSSMHEKRIQDSSNLLKLNPSVENAASNTDTASHQPEVSPGKSANQEIQTVVKVTPKTKDVPSSMHEKRIQDSSNLLKLNPPVENAASNTDTASHQPEVSPGKSANQEIQTTVKVTPKTKDIPPSIYEKQTQDSPNILKPQSKPLVSLQTRESMVRQEEETGQLRNNSLRPVKAEQSSGVVRQNSDSQEKRHDKPQSSTGFMPVIRHVLVEQRSSSKTRHQSEPPVTKNQSTLQPFTAKKESVSTQPPTTPTIMVTIGRIEIRAATPMKTALPKQRPTSAAMSLEAYLRRRDGRGKR